MCEFFSFIVYKDGKDLEIFFSPQSNHHTDLAEMMEMSEDDTWKFEILPEEYSIIRLPRDPDDLAQYYDGGKPFEDLLPMERWKIVEQLHEYRPAIMLMSVLHSGDAAITLRKLLEKYGKDRIQWLVEFPAVERINLNKGRNIRTFLTDEEGSGYWFWNVYIHTFRTNLGDEVKEIRSFLYQIEEEG